MPKPDERPQPHREAPVPAEGEPSRRRLGTSHLVVGYAMSRLDRRYLQAFGATTWSAAFESAATRLEAPASSIKLLRDEFDPLHDNPRKGWNKRPMLGNRQRVALELSAVSDEALIELVRHVLLRDEETTGEALDALSPASPAPEAAANRLLTGRRAEEYVLENCKEVLGHPRSALADMRESLLGFDFLLETRPEIVVEIKGLRASRGDLLFTDREWREANRRRQGYWLAVVGALDSTPRAEVIRDPARSPRISARCLYERSIRASWRSRFQLSA